MGTSYLHKYPGITAPQPGQSDWVPCIVERVEWNEDEGAYEIFVRTPHELKQLGKEAIDSGRAKPVGEVRRRTITGTAPRTTGYAAPPDSMHSVADWSREDQAKWAQARKEETIGIEEGPAG